MADAKEEKTAAAAVAGDAVSADLPWVDAQEDCEQRERRRSSAKDAEAVEKETLRAEGAGSRRASRRSSRLEVGPGLSSRRGSRVSARLDTDEELELLEETALEVEAARLSRRGSRAGSRRASRRLSRSGLLGEGGMLAPPGAGGGGGSRRGSRMATDIAEVVIAELQRPTRKSSRAIALELGEIVSVQVRRQSSVDGEEVTTEIARTGPYGPRPSLLVQRGSAAGASADGDDEDDDDDDYEEEAVQEPQVFVDQGSQIPQYVAAIAVNLVSFCNAMVFGWPAIAIPALQSPMTPITGHALSNEEASWIAATICLSAAISTPFWIAINDRYGRKVTGYTVGMAFALHWVLVGATRNVACLYVARAIGGLGSGGCFIVCPMYVKEISEDDIRGRLGVVFSIMFNLGMLITYIVGALVSYKGINILGVSFVLLFLLCFWQLPETPAFLLSKGRNIAAARSLQWLRGGGADILDELTGLKRQERRRREDGDATWVEVIGDKASFKGVIIATILCINQPLSGLPVVLSYTVPIFMAAGASLSPSLSSIIVGALFLIGSYFASYLVERLGRKMLMLVSNAALAVCLAALGLFFFIKEYMEVDIDVLHLGWLPVTSLSVYMIAASLGVAPLPFVVINEIFLPEAQKFASTLGYIVIWFFSFIATKFFTNIADSLGLYTCYWIFACVCVLIAIFTQNFMPETRNRSLDSILDELAGEQEVLLPPPVTNNSKKTLA